MSKKKFQEKFLNSLRRDAKTPELKIGLQQVNLDMPVSADSTHQDGTSEVSTSREIDSNSNSETELSTNYYQSHNQKKKVAFYRKPLFWSMALLVFGAAFFALAGLDVYAQTRREIQDKSLSECKIAISEATKKGIKTDGMSCEASFGWGNLFGEDLAAKELSNIKQKLSDKEADLKNLSKVQDERIQNLKADLVNMQVDLDAESSDKLTNQELFDESNLQTQIEQKQKYADHLQDLRDKNLPVIQQTIDSFAKLMESNPDLNFAEEKIVLSNYKAQTQPAQIKGFPDFKTQFDKLQQKTESAAPVGRKTVSSTELTKYKTFSAADFQNLYNSTRYDKVNPITTSPSITGNLEADNHIVAIAESRGYKMRFEALSSGIVNVDGQSLQTQSRDAWLLMKQAASREGINLGLVSGFRSVDLQRSIFNDALQQVAIQKIGRAYTSAEIISGNADDGINAVLDTRSIPGYSKHHTGYTIDVTDSGSGLQFTAFRNTPAYSWMSANNYYNAKRFGFIPSYPTGGASYGPQPEAWEYVWVGEQALLK